ncbi:hypothetical protein D1P53_005317 [Cryptococcus gattii VGV]|nr:hypothetical protein D1P53_005317 [Cryptococcus gattii VGV]
MSTLASVFRDYDRFTWGRLGTATIGLGWVMTFLLFGILLFEVVYTLISFGCSYTIWSKPFNRLATYDNSTSGGGIVSAILDEANMGTVSTGVPDTHAANAIAKGPIDEQAVPLSALTTSEGIAAPVPARIHPPAPAPKS